MFATIGRSFRLVKLCLHVLAVDKELILFPLFSSIGVVLVMLTFLGVGLGIGALDRVAANGAGPGDLVVAFAFYVLSYFVIIFFNSALVFAAHERLAGGDPNIRSGLNGASQSIATIFVWAVVAATVGLILNILSSQARQRGGMMGMISHIIISMLGAAWTLITFFVVPLIVIERRSFGDAFKTSLSMLRRTWGEQIVANFGLGIAAFLSYLVAGRDHCGAVLCPFASRRLRRLHGNCHRRRAHSRHFAGVRNAGRHLQGGPVQLRRRRHGAKPLPGGRNSGRVPPGASLSLLA